MSNLVHLNFHLARAEAERGAAMRAACDQTRNIHLQLAERHADQAWSLGEGYAEDNEAREAA